MTDFVIASSLSEHYQNHALANENAHLRQEVSSLQNQLANERADDAALRSQLAQKSGSAQMTEAMKAQIAQQVRAEIQAQAQNNQSLSLGTTLMNKDYLYIASSEFDLSYVDNNKQTQNCAISEGDLFKVIRELSDSELEASKAVEIQVVTAKREPGACSANTVATMSIEDLTEIKNEMATRVEAGVKAAHDNQGKGGLPKATDPNTDVENSPKESKMEADKLLNAFNVANTNAASETTKQDDTENN